MRARTTTIAGLIAVLLLAGCTQTPDDALVRAIFTYKDPLGEVLRNESSASDLAEKIQSDTSALDSQFWEKRSDPEQLGLADGGFAVWDVGAKGDEVFFDAMISSGSREGSDASIYTCLRVQASVPLDQWSSIYVELDCPQELVSTLGPWARFVSINYFQG